MCLISNLGQNSRYSPFGSSKLKLDRPASGAAPLADGPCCKFTLELGYQTRRTSGETRRADQAFSIRNLRPPRLWNQMRRRGIVLHRPLNGIISLNPPNLSTKLCTTLFSDAPEKSTSSLKKFGSFRGFTECCSIEAAVNHIDRFPLRFSSPITALHLLAASSALRNLPKSLRVFQWPVRIGSQNTKS